MKFRDSLLCDVTLIAGESPDDQTEADTQMTSTEAEDDQVI